MKTSNFIPFIFTFFLVIFSCQNLTAQITKYVNQGLTIEIIGIQEEISYENWNDITEYIAGRFYRLKLKLSNNYCNDISTPTCNSLVTDGHITRVEVNFNIPDAYWCSSGNTTHTQIFYKVPKNSLAPQSSKIVFTDRFRYLTSCPAVNTLSSSFSYSLTTLSGSGGSTPEPIPVISVPVMVHAKHRIQKEFIGNKALLFNLLEVQELSEDGNSWYKGGVDGPQLLFYKPNRQYRLKIKLTNDYWMNINRIEMDLNIDPVTWVSTGTQSTHTKNILMTTKNWIAPQTDKMVYSGKFIYTGSANALISSIPVGRQLKHWVQTDEVGGTYNIYPKL